MRDWCSECQFANFGGSQEPCYNCVTAYNKKPSEFTPATEEVRDYAELCKRLRGVAKLERYYNASGKLFDDAADAIEELLEEKAKLENSGKFLVAAFDLAKEKLERYRHAAFIISETCVDESKGHISPEDAIKKIRESIYYDNTASCSDPLDEVV